ncbi:MAG: hypothetical protein Q4E89_05505 [Eubacteriales bacterium]|nr:hypothetical protein [Eubacteriales bacterium]
MENKYMAMMLGMMLTVSSIGISAFPVLAEENSLQIENAQEEDTEETDAEEGSEEKTEESSSEEGLEAQTEAEENGASQQEEGIYGKVTAVGENTLTIAVGTREETQAEALSGQETSMLNLTGESMDITVTENTVLTRQSMGGLGGQPGEGGGQPPEKPEGEQQPSGEPEGEGGEQPSEQPEGEGREQPPEKPEGEGASESISLSEIQEGDYVLVLLDSEGNAETVTLLSMDKPDGMGNPGGQSQAVESYEAATEFTENTEAEGTSYTSSGTDENAVHILNGAQVSLENITVERSSQDSTGGDTSSFYGVGAAVLATDGTAYLNTGSITTDSRGGAGLFAYGDGTIYASDITISTEQDTSGGIHAAGGGTLYAWNLNVETDGESAAAIRSDRGGGTMVVEGGTYTSNGVGSPAVYCTADIAVSSAQLSATGSEAVCIEGRNSLHLFDCDLTGDMQDLEQNDCTWNVILYQSMSGDSEVGNSIFEMNGGSLTTENGGMFYTTNTECTITLSDVDITYADDGEFFLQCTGNTNDRGWGNAGANGSDCLFTAVSQNMEGNVIWDSISDLDFYMTQDSTLTGAIIQDETWAGEGGDGYCSLSLDEQAVWTVTGDSTLTHLSCAGTIADENGNAVTIQGTDGTIYVEGNSDYVITVESYDEQPDFSQAAVKSAWGEYQVDKPSELA